FAGFGEIHKAGHFFWKFQDPAHPEYPGPHHPLATAYDEIYRVLDRELARVCASAGEDIDIVVVADRGMRANYRGDHLVIPLLRQWGLFASDKESARNVQEPHSADELRALENASEPLVRRIKRHVPVALRPLLRRLGGFDMDWSRIKVFPLPE